MQKAFTLIELLVVVLIIGILSAVALPQYRFSVERARAAEAVINIRAWADALQRYYLANGNYPINTEEALANIDITLPTLSNNASYHYYFSDTSSDNTVYVAVVSQNYILSRTLRGYHVWVERGLTCGVSVAAAEGNTLGAKLCKSLCGTSTLNDIWGSPGKGCSIGY